MDTVGNTPLEIPTKEWQNYYALEQERQAAKTTIPKGSSTSSDYEKAYEKVSQQLKKIYSLNLPPCSITCTAWTTSFEPTEPPRCVQLLFSVSSPSPQPLWIVSRIPEDLLDQGIPIPKLKSLASGALSGPIILQESKSKGFGLIASNVSEALASMKEVHLDKEGKSLANSWLENLEQANALGKSEQALIFSKNIKLLLQALHEHSPCSFQEREFAPFIQALHLEPALITLWKEGPNPFITPNLSNTWTDPLSSKNIDLNQEGKSLAKNRLEELKKAQAENKTKEADTLSQNLLLLLNTLQERASCSFEEKEFAPFIQALNLKPSLLSTWRKGKNPLIIPTKWKIPSSTQELSLNQEGKSLARQWLAQLKKAQAENKTEEARTLSKNLLLLLKALYEETSCFFKEKEFAPFIQPLKLEPSTLEAWRSGDKPLIVPDKARPSLSSIARKERQRTFQEQKKELDRLEKEQLLTSDEIKQNRKELKQAHRQADRDLKLRRANFLFKGLVALTTIYTVSSLPGVRLLAKTSFHKIGKLSAFARSSSRG